MELRIQLTTNLLRVDFYNACFNLFSIDTSRFWLFQVPALKLYSSAGFRVDKVASQQKYFDILDFNEAQMILQFE